MARAGAEPPLEQRIGGQEIAGEVRRQEEPGDDEAADDVTDQDLQVGQRPTLLRPGERSEASAGTPISVKRARLGGDDRQTDDDPGGVARAEEVVLDASAAPGESASRK